MLSIGYFVVIQMFHSMTLLIEGQLFLRRKIKFSIPLVSFTCPPKRSAIMVTFNPLRSGINAGMQNTSWTAANNSNVLVSETAQNYRWLGQHFRLRLGQFVDQFLQTVIY